MSMIITARIGGIRLKNSGGGVGISGNDVLCQQSAIDALMTALSATCPNCSVGPGTDSGNNSGC